MADRDDRRGDGPPVVVIVVLVAIAALAAIMVLEWMLGLARQLVFLAVVVAIVVVVIARKGQR